MNCHISFLPLLTVAKRYQFIVALLLMIPSLSLAGYAQVTVVNAATYDGRKILAPDAISAAFGSFVTQNDATYVARTIPLPTVLGGVSVRINGVTAPLFFVSKMQINLLVPGTLADSLNATIEVTNSNGVKFSGPCYIIRNSPGLFTAAATGNGVVAGQSTYDGKTYSPTYHLVNNVVSELGVDPRLVNNKPNILVLYGTGIRHTPAANPNDGNGVAEAVRVSLQGIPLTVLYAGPVNGLVGLDQVNVVLPPESSGFGNCKLTLDASPYVPQFGQTPIPTVRIGGPIPASRSTVTPLGLNTPITGELTDVFKNASRDDGTGNVYLHNAYKFSVTANTPVAIEMSRESSNDNSLDCVIQLFRVSGGTLIKVGEDDQTGGYGTGASQFNGNALLIALLTQAGDYVAYATTTRFSGTGKYTIKLFTPSITPVTYGSTLNTYNITANDVRNSKGVYLKVLYFTAATGDNLQINMRSFDYQSLFVLQPNGFSVNPTFSGFAAKGNIATLVRTINVGGIHMILATPYEPNVTGSFTLSVSKIG